jgi:hypothetical protein
VLTLLQTRGYELCHATIGPPWVRHHLYEGMWLAALCHTKMARELVMLLVAVSFAMESVFGRSPNDTFHVEVVVSWPSNSRRSRIGARGLSGLP